MLFSGNDWFSLKIYCGKYVWHVSIVYGTGRLQLICVKNTKWAQHFIVVYVTINWNRINDKCVLIIKKHYASTIQSLTEWFVDVIVQKFIFISSVSKLNDYYLDVRCSISITSISTFTNALVQICVALLNVNSDIFTGRQL